MAGSDGALRLVLDTNILVSRCWKPGGLEDELISRSLEGEFVICISLAVLAEYRDVLLRKKFSRFRLEADALLSAIESTAMRVFPQANASFGSTEAGDENDNQLLDCALAGAADWLITGNLADFPSSPWKGIKIANARQFFQHVKE